MVKQKKKLKIVTGGGNLQFRIEKNVPIPVKATSSKAYKNPYEDDLSSMDLWDCMVIGKNDKLKGKVVYHAKIWGKAANKSFIFRNTEDGWKMWRIK